MDLTDQQWKIVEPILPSDLVREDGRGRPWSDRRKVLEGVLWILRTGAPWKDTQKEPQLLHSAGVSPPVRIYLLRVKCNVKRGYVVGCLAGSLLMIASVKAE